MPRFSAHIGYLYADLPLVDRLEAAARDGFTAVEHPEPWAIPAKEMRKRLDDLGLVFSQVTSGMGDAGEKGLAALAGREAGFRAGFQQALDYAAIVGCPFVHPMAGVPKGGWLEAGETYLLNLAWSLERCNGSGIRPLVEAITLPGYYMGSLALAAQVQDQFAGRISLLFDSFHAVALGEDPAGWITANAARIGHVHIADHPGRHEPGTGQIDFAALLLALRRANYGGAIGFEFIPSFPSTSESTRFLTGWKRDLLPDASSLPTGVRA